MIARPILTHAKRMLWETSHSPFYLPIVALLAAGATLSMSVPTTALLIPAVMLRPQRWHLICLVAVLGAAFAATLLSYGFHQQGWNQLQAAYPELSASDSWKKVVAWIAEYGLLALAAICALPLPQTPALIICAVSNQPLAGIFLAVATGKLAKYGVLSWMVATFPERFIHYLHKDDPR
jgi:membrane protein YqaA with SNARE-associated domain